MPHRYQSPPSWPPPPPGWVPPPGWRPDPSWGPAPEGWQFWVDQGSGRTAGRPNRGAWGWALLSALLWWVIHILGLTLATSTFNAEMTGAFFASYLLGGLATGLIAFLMRVRWPLWVYPLAVLPPVIFFLFLGQLGRMSSGA